MKTTTLKIGVISDTHGYLDPVVPRLFAGVDHILHAGDVGLLEVTYRLEEIAPVTVVLGNVDGFLHFRETEVVELGGWKILVHHIFDVRSPGELVKERIAREQPDVVVFGHTHKPFSERVGEVLYFNPGYAGRMRFGLPRSLGMLYVDSAGVRPELTYL